MPTVIKINAITVPKEAGDELAKRFAARAGAVDGQDGFEGFELLKPTDDREQWLVVTRWRVLCAWTKPASPGSMRLCCTTSAATPSRASQSGA